MVNMLNKMYWIVSGDVLNPTKAAFKVVQKLKSHGKKVYSVNPRYDDDIIKSQTNVFTSMPVAIRKCIEDSNGEVPVMNLIINPALGINLIKEANDLGVKQIFIQPGAGSDAIASYCDEKGIDVHNGCVLVELH